MRSLAKLLPLAAVTAIALAVLTAPAEATGRCRIGGHGHRGHVVIKSHHGGHFRHRVHHPVRRHFRHRPLHHRVFVHRRFHYRPHFVHRPRFRSFRPVRILSTGRYYGSHIGGVIYIRF